MLDSRFNLSATSPFLTYPPTLGGGFGGYPRRNLCKPMKTGCPPVRHPSSAYAADWPIRQSATTL
jgi:hypothetical protein